LDRSLPRTDFANYVGLHENLEIIGKKTIEVMCAHLHDKKIHGDACKGELEGVFKRNQDFIEAYANWLVNLDSKIKHKEGYFNRAIPNFLDIIREGKLSPIELLRLFKQQLDLGYHIKE